jgi:hypothetical protein
MTPQETKEAAQVMLAAAQVMLEAEYDASGECLNVEYSVNSGKWNSVSFPSWAWHDTQYRIKPKPELKKAQIIEVSDDGRLWKLRRFSEWANPGRVFAYDGIGCAQHDCIWKLWRLPE